MQNIDKQAVIKHALTVIDAREEQLTNMILEINEQINQDGKSSAGDKFETGRERLTQELNAQQSRYNQLLQHKRKLIQLRGDALEQIKEGALSCINGNWYFIGPALGKILYNTIPIWFISTEAPIVKQMIQCKKGDSFIWNEREMLISEIY